MQSLTHSTCSSALGASSGLCVQHPVPRPLPIPHPPGPPSRAPIFRPTCPSSTPTLPPRTPVCSSNNWRSNSRPPITQSDSIPLPWPPPSRAPASPGPWPPCRPLGGLKPKNCFLLTLTNPTSLRPHAQDSSLAVCSRRKRSLHLQIISST